MSKGSVAIAVIALMLAAGAVGYIGYEAIQPSSIGLGTALFIFEKLFPPPQPKNVWYTEYNNMKYTNPASSYNLFGELTTDFVVRSGESVYFCFRSVIFFPVSAIRIAGAYFVVDGTDYISPVMSFTVDASTTNLVHTGVLQYSLSLSPGTHNVTVKIYGSSTSMYFDDSRLF